MPCTEVKIVVEALLLLFHGNHLALMCNHAMTLLDAELAADRMALTARTGI